MGSRKIILADDKSDRLAHTTARLRNAGYEVFPTSSATDAASRATAKPADLLITNYTLRESSGVELCQGLRHDARTAGLPAILVAAPGYALGSSIPASAGIQRILSHESDLLSAVNELFHRHAA